MHITLLDILLLVSLSQGFIFGLVVLFTSFFKGKTNKYLAYSILLTSFIGLAEFLSSWNFDDQYYLVDLLGDDIPWILLFYVPLFIYFLRSAHHPLAADKKLRWLYFPFFLFLFFNLVINLQIDFHLYQLPAIESVMFFTYSLEYYLALTYCVFLCIWSFFIIRRRPPSDATKKWLTQIWLFTTVLIICWLLIVFRAGQNNPEPNQYLWLGISFFIYWLTYQGLYRFQLSQDQEAIQRILLDKSSNTKSTTAKPPQKAANETATPTNTYLQELKALMEREHLYRNPNLSRDIVANRLGISPGYLSQLISVSSNKNFTSFINDYRIADTKLMICDTSFDQYSLLAIGMEAGFRSKSAFYTTFKKATGLTPSAYKKQQQKVRIS